MSLWSRTRALEEQLAAARQEVGDLRDLATARLGVIDDLAEKVVQLEAVVDALNTALARHLEFHPAPGRDDSASESAPEHAPDPPADEEQSPGARLEEALREPAPAELVLTDEQAALVAAVNELGEAMTGEIAAHVGRPDQPDAVGMALKRLRGRGLVGHNGRRAKGARWLAVGTDTPDPAPPRPEPEADPEPEPTSAPEPEPAPELEVTSLDERIVALVAEHGPVTPVWVADQLVKNRRETAARMRDLARGGLLVDLDGAFATPDIAQAA